MWIYEKKLQYPVKIKNPNKNYANIIISQLGGPDGELAASMRYLHQRYSCPYDKVTGILTDVGTEELAHLEMIAAILYQLTKDLTPDEIEGSPFATYFVDHTTGLYPVAASGVPFDMKYVGVKGDIITDLNEDLAADAAILQEQPLSKNRRKALKYKDFSHFGKTLKNCHPAII
ncbi:MAG: manganese catalase family protein [Ruminococcaceae bacterium]|nr:manganese catalase family protein [Oscillospiraceae bacterium]